MSKDDKLVWVDEQCKMVLEKKGYTLDKVLNSGAFGQVWKGKDTRNDNRPVAIKIMDLGKIDKIIESKFWPRELAALRDLEHEYIIAVYDSWRMSGRILTVMEFADNGDIIGYMKNHGNKPLAESLSCFWFKQVRAVFHWKNASFTKTNFKLSFKTGVPSTAPHARRVPHGSS